MHIRNFTRIVLAVVGLLIAVPAAFAQQDAQIRFVHAFVDAPNVDIYVNDAPVAQDVPFGVASDFIPVNTGDVSIAATAAGTADELFSQVVTTGPEPLTLVVSDNTGFVRYADNVDPLNTGQARLTAIHAIEGGPAVDVVLTDGRPVIVELAYATPYGTLDVPAFNYGLNVIPTGGSLEDAIFAEPFFAPLATGTSYTAVVYGTLDAPQVMLLAAPVNPNPGDGFLQLTHNVTDGPAVDVYANDNLIVPGLAAGESTELFPVAAGTYDVQIVAADTVDIITGGDVTIDSGAEVTAVVNAGDDGVTIDVEAAAAPVTEEVVVEPTAAPTTAEVVVAEPTPVPAAEVVVQQPTQPAAIIQPTVPPPPDARPTGRVIIDPGANLQLRQYPDSESLSLGLAPSGAVLTIEGREGPPAQIEGLFNQQVQDEIDAFVDPAEDLPEDADLNPANTWLYASYVTPDGGTIEAWVLSQFLDVRNADGEIQRLADLPLIPNNNFGQATNTEVTPPPIREDAVVARVFNLNPGVNLQVRRTPSTQGESLALLPNGTEVELLGFGIGPSELPSPETADNAEWVFIRYTPAEGGEVIGWSSGLYLTYLWRGEPIDFEEMEDRNLLLFEDLSTRGELSAGAVAPPRPTVDPLADQVVATVAVDPGANLQFRRDPSATSESLGLIPSGTQLIVTGRDTTGEWLFVEFEGQTGWIARAFTRLTFNGAVYDNIEELVIVPGF